MASVASVAVELYEFCFFLLPFPHGLWEAAPQSKVSCLMYGLRSTAVHNLFKMCLSELMELTERPTNTSISHDYVVWVMLNLSCIIQTYIKEVI
uniref:Uncharacterized protein n=1 Tax=Apteryx owenii TaxID=8824 RepID=A0A8B9S7V8_APTOW